MAKDEKSEAAAAAKDESLAPLLRRLIELLESLPEALAGAAEKAAERAKLEKAEREKPEPHPELELDGKVDSIAPGKVHLWPILAKESAELSTEIRAGRYDGIVSELLTMEECHRKRELVMEACKARGGSVQRAAPPPRKGGRQPEPTRLPR